MCGIVGYVGEGNIPKVIIQGLSRLEYRGYDSAGMMLVNPNKKTWLFKEAGRIAQLEAVVNLDIKAQAGIGHTRWATHGKANRKNAHPHQSSSGRFGLVHNGVIENHDELKEKYLDEIKLVSTTDTEVVVVLIEKKVLQEQLSVEEAFKQVLKLIKGSYAFVLLDKETPNQLLAAKNKSPLLIGKGTDFNLITSDTSATVTQTLEYIELTDQEIVKITPHDVEIENLKGEKINRKSFKAEIDEQDIDKGTYPFYMLKEIEEQPAVIRRNLAYYLKAGDNFNMDPALIKAVRLSDRIYIIACGTSYHAGLMGKSFIEKFAHIPTEVHIASEFAYHPPLLSENPFFIFISQSGETADSRQALVKIKEKNYPSLTITNVKGSTLWREADFGLLLNAGPEIAVASTKAYTAQLVVLAILAHNLADENTIRDLYGHLSNVALQIEQLILKKELIHFWVKKNLSFSKNAFYIGRYQDYFVALEAALKLKEISYIHTEAFPSGELKHGTIALIEEGTPVIGIVTDEITAPNIRSNIEEVKTRGAVSLVIASENLAQGESDFKIGSTVSDYAPMVAVVVTQLIAYYAALDRGLNVDKPRNLAKSVTVE